MFQRRALIISILNCQLSIVNFQLSIVNSQLLLFLLFQHHIVCAAFDNAR